MKKLFSVIAVMIVACVVHAQNIDTVYVRNLQLKAEEWYWLKAGWTPADSAQKKTWKKIRTTLVAAAPAGNGTLVTIDSIPGRIALFFYSDYVSADKGETGYMSNDANSIATKIKAYTPLLSFTNIIDEAKQASFQNRRKNGKDDFEN